MNLKKTNIITINYYDITIWSPIWLLFIFFCKVTMVVGLIQRKTLKSLKSTEYVTIFVQFFYLWFPVLSTEYVTIFVQFFHLWFPVHTSYNISTSSPKVDATPSRLFFSKIIPRKKLKVMKCIRINWWEQRATNCRQRSREMRFEAENKVFAFRSREMTSFDVCENTITNLETSLRSCIRSNPSCIIVNILSR